MAIDQKKPIPLNPITENRRELANVEKRLAQLEEIQQQLEKSLDEKDAQMNQDSEDFKIAVEEHSKQIIAMKAELKEFIIDVMAYVKQLQLTAKTEDMERLNLVAEKWTPENWATRNEIIKTAQRILDEEADSKK